MAKNSEKLTTPLNSVPFDELIASVGSGIAEAQRKLDAISFEITRMMSGSDPRYRLNLSGDPKARTYSLLELGFTPTFYQFVDTVLEVKIAFSMNSQKSGDETLVQAKGATVDAAYANRYSYPIEGSSVLRTKLVTVAPPGLLEERVRSLAAPK